MDIGSTPKPSAVSPPSSQTTATSEQAKQRHGQANGARVGVHEERGDEEGDPEEGHDPDRSRRDVPHHLGEPDDVHVDIHVHARIRARLSTDPFELVRDFYVVEALAGVRVKLLQLGADDSHRWKSFATRRPTIPALMMFSRTRAKPASLGSKSTGKTSPAAMPSSTTSMKRHVGSEDREDLGPIHAGQEEGRVGHFPQAREELGGEHVSVPRHQRDDHPIRAAELVAVLEEGLHVLVLERHQLGEAGIDAQTRGEPGHGQGDDREDRDDETAAGEEQVLEARAHDSCPPGRGGRSTGGARREGRIAPARAAPRARRT